MLKRKKSCRNKWRRDTSQKKSIFNIKLYCKRLLLHINDMFLIFISSHHEQEYFDEVHRVTVPKPMDGEKLGLTVQSQNGCIVVTRILGKFFLQGQCRDFGWM